MNLRHNNHRGTEVAATAVHSKDLRTWLVAAAVIALYVLIIGLVLIGGPSGSS